MKRITTANNNELSEVNSLLSATPGRGTKNTFREQFRVLKKLRSRGSCLVFFERSHKHWEFSSYNSIPGPCSNSRGYCENFQTPHISEVSACMQVCVNSNWPGTQNSPASTPWMLTITSVRAAPQKLVFWIFCSIILGMKAPAEVSFSAL